MLRTILMLTVLVVAARSQEVLRVIAMPTPEECQEAGQTGGVPIDEALLRSWRKHRDMAVAQGAQIIVLEVTTPGGRLDITREMLKDLDDLRRFNGIRTYAYVPYQATSAGAIVALGAKNLILGVGAAIGNAIPIQMQGTGSFREAPRKLMAEVLSDMDSIAGLGGFDAELLRSMVDPDMDLWAMWGASREQTLFLTLDALDRQYPQHIRERQGLRVRHVVGDSSALKVVQGARYDKIPGFDAAFPHQVARSRDDIPGLVGLESRPLKSEELIRMPPPKGLGYFFHLAGRLDWTLLLLVAGLAFFVMELKTPGLGAFGAVGILCLVAFFAVQQGDDGLDLAFTVGMLILGFFLLLAEVVIIPGFGVAGVSGILLILFSIYAASVGLEGDSRWEKLVPDSDEDWEKVRDWLTRLLGSSILAVVGSITVAKQLHRVPLFNRAFVRPPVLEPVASTGVTATGKVPVVVGARGVADTDLRPSGHAAFPEGSVDVVSEGEFVPKGEPVEVVQVEGLRVIVSRVREDTP